MLSRMTVVLVAGNGMVLLSCLKVTRRTFSNSQQTHSSNRFQTALYEYYALASSVAAISKHLGGVLAFSILSDLVPLCGWATRLLFQQKWIRKIVCTKLSMYSPFVLLHKQACNFKLELLEHKRQMFQIHPEVPTIRWSTDSRNLNDFDQLLQAFEEQPLTVTLFHGFQIRENFSVIIATVLSSYVVICYQLLRETSSVPASTTPPTNCTCSSI
ncbi:hypothetical protein BV898_18566 [Hypsibius exemplaris]|uniref:Uncharacterized protein n=1 Tax=Hypsibius exemplaris TaxID=2072580 RepID=A0A9X6NH53_HYPEX|nr:hypothetical protein BV898_18566 [Hypsibius exemplaris]